MTEEGKSRSAQNALKHGLRALKYVVLPDEDAVEFQTLESALLDELAPVGALQLVLARRVAVAAWRLARADRMEVELFEERRWDNGGVGIALIRDGNGTRSFETLLRYRGAAMAEFWRALRTLKALQAEQALPVEQALETSPALAPHPLRPAARPSPAAERTRAHCRAPAGIRSARAGQARAAPCASPLRPGRRTNPRAPRPTPTGSRAEPTVRARPHAARSRCALATERTRERCSGSPGSRRCRARRSRPRHCRSNEPNGLGEP
jgi:hypothetical protein